MKILMKITALILLFISTSIIVSCDKNDEDENLTDNNTPVLNDADAEGLIFMREEEKLARDTYMKMYELWSDKVFSNITQSEQTHMDLLLNRVEEFGLKDKDVVLSDIGKFVNQDLQNLYNQLVKQGADSSIAGFIVGATIEEVDIVDLKKYLDKTTNEDLKCTYNVLITGSRNHLCAFVRSMNNAGYNYSPQYLDSTEYQNIINGSHEKAPSCN